MTITAEPTLNGGSTGVKTPELLKKKRKTQWLQTNHRSSSLTWGQTLNSWYSEDRPTPQHPRTPPSPSLSPYPSHLELELFGSPEVHLASSEQGLPENQPKKETQSWSQFTSMESLTLASNRTFLVSNSKTLLFNSLVSLALLSYPVVQFLASVHQIRDRGIICLEMFEASLHLLLTGLPKRRELPFN